MSNDPHLAEDQADPKLREHYQLKNRRSSPFYERVAKEEERIRATGEVRRATCVICGTVTIVDSIAFALARLCTEELVERGESPLTPGEVGFTCSIPCHSEKQSRQTMLRRGQAPVSRRHYTEEPDDAV